MGHNNEFSIMPANIFLIISRHDALFIMGIQNQEALFIVEGVRTLLGKPLLGFCLFAASPIEFVD